MINFRRAIAFVLLVLIMARLTPPANACGPSYLEPIFVFRGSPDLPFEDFVNGNIGIVLPTFGRKTLVIAYRYLNGGSFNTDEQKELIKALKGAPPDGGENRPLRDWIAARKEFVNKDEPTPEIYVERRYGGYDFFPNCASNAFEVATATLRERAAQYGSDSEDVREWLAAQDTVFKNCVNGSHLPVEVGMERPEWLRKDRDYQRAAALFYSLKLDAARARFEAIAADLESPWQETADYLVARTLVRQASLIHDEAKKRQLHEQAELDLMRLVSKGGKFTEGSKRLLGLVKYRLRPEDRVRELARTLTFEHGNQNLRQDVIDYVWLLDKFESAVLKEQEARKRDSDINEDAPQPEPREEFEAFQRGELLQIFWVPKTELYSGHPVMYFKPDVPESVVILMFETRLGRPLMPDEAKEIVEAHKSALLHREQLISPNRQLHINDYEGVEPGKLNRKLAPEFLTADDLSDWIFAVQSEDVSAYDHAFSKWRESGSHAWLIAALMKADRSSAGLDRLTRAAEKVDRDLPAFAGSFYHLVRLKTGTGKKVEAREMLDAVTKTGLDHLPVSTQNLFAEQQMLLAQDLTGFLRAGLRTPVAFNDDGRVLSRAKFFELSAPSEEDSDAHRFQLPQEFEGNALPEDIKDVIRREAEAEFQRLSAWKDRPLLDPKTTEILNTHFPLPALLEASRSAALPDYLRQRIALVIWIRAIVLQRPLVADKVVPELVNYSSEMRSVLAPYLSARTAKEKERAALFVLLKNPNLSPLIADGLPPSPRNEDYFIYYYESAWWCPPSLTEYTLAGDQVTKNVPVPPFLSAEQVAEAKRDQARLIEIGDAKSYLGRRVLEWAKAAPGDPRVPEALLIASRANAQYKYGCDGWNYDKTTKEQAERLLRTRYPNSVWTEKLRNEKR